MKPVPKKGRISMFELKKTEGKARRGEFTCAHGTVQTPVFMNVGTQGAIKGALSAEDLKNIGCQVELSNTYHLHLRPTDKVVREMGGLLAPGTDAGAWAVEHGCCSEETWLAKAGVTDRDLQRGIAVIKEKF